MLEDRRCEELQGLSHEMVGYIALDLAVHEVVLGDVSHYYGSEVNAPSMRQGTPPKECNDKCRPKRKDANS